MLYWNRGYILPPHPRTKLITNESEGWTEYELPPWVYSKNRHCNASMSANLMVTINYIFWTTKKVLEKKLL